MLKHRPSRVDGVEMDSSFIKEKMGCLMGTYIVPNGCYFMMDDNQNDSYNSSYWGSVPQESILAKACFIIFPFSRTGSLSLSN